MFNARLMVCALSLVFIATLAAAQDVPLAPPAPLDATMDSEQGQAHARSALRWLSQNRGSPAAPRVATDLYMLGIAGGNTKLAEQMRSVLIWEVPYSIQGQSLILSCKDAAAARELFTERLDALRTTMTKETAKQFVRALRVAMSRYDAALFENGSFGVRMIAIAVLAGDDTVKGSVAKLMCGWSGIDAKSKAILDAGYGDGASAIERLERLHAIADNADAQLIKRALIQLLNEKDAKDS